jgi:tetratricopeptide (TPR) repeat protein
MSTQEQLNIARDFAQKGNYTKAVSILDGFLEQNPNNIDALLDRGYYKEELGNGKSAVEDYSKVLKLDPKNTLAFFNRALAYSSFDKEQALKNFNQAILTKGGDVVWVDNTSNSSSTRPYDIPMKVIRFERGIVHYDMNHLEAAFQDFTFCINNNYVPEESYYYRGLIYLAYKNSAKGCEDLNFAKSLGNSDADTLINTYCNNSIN